MNKLKCVISKTEKSQMWVIDLKALDEKELVSAVTILYKAFLFDPRSAHVKDEKFVLEDCVEAKKFCCVSRKKETFAETEALSRQRMKELSIEFVECNKT